jgi:uroporphyrinogen decarboxylase
MEKKKATMTDRERIEALLRREKPDRVPIWPFACGGFAVVYTGTSIADAYNKPEVALAAQRKTCQEFGWVFVPMMAYAAYGGWEFGGEIKWPSGEFAQAPMILKYPVETLEDAMNLKLPEIRTAGMIPLMKQFYELSSQERLDNEPFNAMFLGAGAVFTIAGNICGVEMLARWMLRKPEATHRLLQLSADYTVATARYWKDTLGLEGLLPFGGEPTSANQVISPKQFEQFALPYIKDAHEKILAMGYKHIYEHICGEHNANLPYWAQIPMGDPGIISIGHEVELATAARYFPNDIILGNLEPAIIRTSSPQEVYEATKGVVEKGKKLSTGYIFSPGCDLPPMAPVENVRAMTQAVNDFGWYD